MQCYDPKQPSLNRMTQSLADKQDLARDSPIKKMTIGSALNILRLSEMSQYCIGCLQTIGNTVKYTCPFCSRSVHQQCSMHLFEQGKSILDCRYCLLDGQCLICKKASTNNQNNIKCSMCYQSIHLQCYKLPLQLFELSRIYFKSIYGKRTRLNKIVCNQCQILSKSSRLVYSVILNNIKYGFYKINHYSPIHFTWKLQHSQLNNENIMENQDSVVEVDQKSNHIQNIVSIHVKPTLSQNFTIKQIYFNCIHRERTQIKQNQRYKFLVKWQNSNIFIWQDQEVIKSYRQLLKNFFNNIIIINLVYQQEHNPIIAKITIDHLQEQLSKRQNIMKRVSLIGSQYQKVSERSQKVQDIVYNFYLQGSKQSIKAKKEEDSFRMEVLGRLINTIYFKHKILAPVLIFTEGKKTTWWVTYLQRICPYHSIVRLVGSERYLFNILDNFFFSHSKNRLNFNIIILTNESISTVMMKLSLNQLVNSASLMVIDEKANDSVRKFYKTVTIPKIKFSTAREEEWNSMSQMKVTKNSSFPSFSNNISKELPNYIQTSGKKEKCTIQTFSREEYPPSQQERTECTKTTLSQSWNELEKQFTEINLFSNKQLDQLQRVVFLRYIMAFGLNFSSLLELAQGINKLQNSFFDEWSPKETEIILNNYMKHFLSATYFFAKNKNQIRNKIQTYYLFDVDASQVLKRITALKQLKTFCDKARKNQSRNYFSDGDLNDLKICQTVLERGFGRWESISEFQKKWQNGWPPRSLRVHFCRKAEIDVVSIDTFCNLLQGRMTSILQGLQI